MESEMFEKF